MTLSEDKITEIFYLVDDFCIQFGQSSKNTLLAMSPGESLHLSRIDIQDIDDGQISLQTLSPDGLLIHSFRKTNHQIPTCQKLNN